jgi:hypothetical protein
VIGRNLVAPFTYWAQMPAGTKCAKHRLDSFYTSCRSFDHVRPSRCGSITPEDLPKLPNEISQKSIAGPRLINNSLTHWGF